MSNKLDEVLKKSKTFYEEEKKKFLDALGDYIESNFYLVSKDNCYKFYIQCDEQGTDGEDKYFRTIYGYKFGENNKDKKDFGKYDVQTTLSINTVLEILKSDYNSTTTKESVAYGNYYMISIPFV